MEWWGHKPRDADTGQNLEAASDRTFHEASVEVCPNILISDRRESQMRKKRGWNDIIKAKRGNCFKDDNGSRLRKDMCQLDLTVNRILWWTFLYETLETAVRWSRLKRESVTNNLKKYFWRKSMNWVVNIGDMVSTRSL